MPNQSKINDRRFWIRWRAAGAVGSGVAVVILNEAARRRLIAEQVVSIPQCGLYVKDRTAFQPLLQQLEADGYELVDYGIEDERPGPKKHWFVSLRDDVRARLNEEEKQIEWLKRTPTGYNIYAAWSWAPLKRSPKLHERIISAAGMVSHSDYYYQDGRPAFDDIHLERMRLFVEHFTELNIEEWDRMIENADRSGPGMIEAIARFCHPNSRVTNESNFGNLLYGYISAANGKRLTEGEAIAMADAWKDPESRQTFRRLFGKA